MQSRHCQLKNQQSAKLVVLRKSPHALVQLGLDQEDGLGIQAPVLPQLVKVFSVKTPWHVGQSFHRQSPLEGHFTDARDKAHKLG